MNWPNRGCAYEDGTAARLADRIEPSRPYVMASDVEIVPGFSRTHTVSGPTSRSGRVEIKFAPRDGFERDAVAFTELLDKGRAVRYGC